MKGREAVAHAPEYLRVPEVARTASEFIGAVEDATQHKVASFDMLAANNDLVATWERWIDNDDALHARHNAIFFSDLMRISDHWQELDYEAILTLTRDMLLELKAQKAPWHSAALGLCVLQLGEAGARIAHNPALVEVDQAQAEAIPEAIVDKGAGITTDAFQTAFAHRIKGDFALLPNVRREYLGHLVDTHYAFWTEPLTINGLSHAMEAKRQRLIPQFSARTRRFDVHSSLGRPPQHIAQQIYVQKLKRFKESMRQGQSGGINLKGNIGDAANAVFGVLDVAIREGFTAEESIKIAVQKSGQVGRLTERSYQFEASEDTIHFEGVEKSTLILSPACVSYDKTLSSKTIGILWSRDENGGAEFARLAIRLLLVEMVKHTKI